ncbi:MAG: hypothetical protein GHCLOJNM_01284 [bacterium]|nr:hypothetical protein [bacterium]
MRKALFSVLVAGAFISAGFAEDPKYCVGIELGEDHVLHVSYDARPVAKGETFEKLRKGDKATADGFNKSNRFGKLGTLKTSKDIKVGDLEVKAGEYPCGFNADEKGAFSFVVWMGEEAKKTPITLEKHEAATIPNLTLMVGPGEKGAALMALYGSYYSIIPLTIPGVGEEAKTSEAAPPKEGEKVAAAEEEKKAEEGQAAEATSEEEEDDSWDDVTTHSFSGRR